MPVTAELAVQLAPVDPALLLPLLIPVRLFWGRSLMMVLQAVAVEMAATAEIPKMEPLVSLAVPEETVVLERLVAQPGSVS